MKKIFRFWRGELNGFFVKALCSFLNFYIEANGVLDELLYHKLFEWGVTEDTATLRKRAMREDDIYNLGKIGGLFPPRSFAYSSVGSIQFVVAPQGETGDTTQAYYDMEYESFMFVKPPRVFTNMVDINTLASEARRATYREKGAELLGYVKSDDDLFTIEGVVMPEKVLQTPPEGIAYVEFYGLKYLHYQENFETELPLSVDVFMLLFEALQKIRRSGASIKSLLDITYILGEGYMHDLEILQDKWKYICYYSIDDKIEVFNRERRYAAWRELLKSKFPLFTFFDRNIQEEG